MIKTVNLPIWKLPPKKLWIEIYISYELKFQKRWNEISVYDELKNLNSLVNILSFLPTHSKNINFQLLTETWNKTVNLTKIKNWKKLCRGGLIYEIFCDKKLDNCLYKLDRMSCTKNTLQKTVNLPQIKISRRIECFPYIWKFIFPKKKFFLGNRYFPIWIFTV